MADSKDEGNLEENVSNYQQENILSITPVHYLPCVKPESEDYQCSRNIADNNTNLEPECVDLANITNNHDMNFEGNMEENVNNSQQEAIIFNITPVNILPCVKQESDFNDIKHEDYQYSSNLAGDSNNTNIDVNSASGM